LTIYYFLLIIEKQAEMVDNHRPKGFIK